MPLTDKACEHFRRVVSRSRSLERDDFVFCAGHGTILDGSALGKRFRRAQKKVGVRHRRFHDLRHTFGSVAVRRFDPVTVQSLMGHASLTTIQRYLHSRPRADAAARLTNTFEADE